MIYLYHWVPNDMQGDTLFPLNVLKETHPDLYEREASKYAGRENIMLHQIPFLDCLWNDVLHFSAIHPSVVKDALLEAGDRAPFDVEFFEVDPHLLNPENTIVYLYKHRDMSGKLEEDNFTKYNPDDIAIYSDMPDETKQYYKEMLSEGKNPLLFHRVPHILYKGSLDTSNIRRITP